ncbi:MAG TPA: YhjD/YihY/BrkB family envelope integrity protein, partial [Thermoanaerobaculia bacterium]|nr:YhjD/YihY/BrkB family envelope integrity protein [Thermoanaerobaculia bacterium]
MPLRLPMEWWKTLRQVITNWGVHRCSAQSAALAFYTIFSLAPVLVVVITLAGVVWGEEAVRGQIRDEFQGLMGPEAAVLIENVIKSAARPASGRIAAIVGVATLLFGATAIFGQLQDALNTVWAVVPKPGATLTTLLRKRLHSFALVIGIGFLLAVSLVLSAALTGFSR